MKFLVALCLIGVAVAAPQQPRAVADERFSQTLRNDFSPVFGPNFRNSFETENRIQEAKEGTEGSQGQSNIAGSYSYQSPEGEEIVVNYVADENGYRAEGSHIPTPHPLPAHALEQIRIGEQQRAQGIVWN